MATNPYLSIAVKDEDNPYAKIAVNPTETQPAPEKPGFFKSLGNSLGIDTSESKRKDIIEHPIKSAFENYPPVAAAEGLISGGKRIAGELGDAYHSAREGNGAGVAYHAISAVPFLGAGLKTASEQAPPTKPGQSYMSKIKDAATDPGVMGTVMGTAAQTAPLALAATDAAAPARPTIGRIPTRAHAGQVLESIKSEVGDRPVALTRSMPMLERSQQLSERGHGTIGALDNLYKRVNTANPLDFAEARDRASALSSLTGQDKMTATRSLQREAKGFSHAFNEDIGDTAEQVGRGKEYSNAMKEYRRASQIRSGLGTAAKYGVPAIGAALGAGAGAKVLRHLLP